MRCTLIHTQTIGGHQLEYLHHIYMGALKRSEEQFVFVVPQRFEKDSSRLEWPASNNTKIVVMEGDDEPPVNCSIFRKGWINSRTIRKYCKRYHVTDVLTISIMEYLPYLPFLLKNVRFSGIVYRIYLYEWKEEHYSKRFQDVMKYWMMSKFKVFYRVYICNDSSSTQCLNKIFKTDKFRMLPDPVASIQNYKGRNVKDKLGIARDKKVLLHPGGMNGYKNTIGILRALDMLDDESRNGIAVIFAGQIDSGIREEFNRLYQEVCKKVQLILFEGYLPFEQLADLFSTCDFVLVPYNVKSQSSGIVGHAAYYGKPVIAMEGGVIGKMVRKWHLGKLLYRSSEVSLYQFLCSLRNTDVYDTNGNGYLDCHSIDLFNKTLLDS